MGTESQTVHVDLSERAYDIEIGTGILPNTAELITQHDRITHAIVVTDTNVAQPHAAIVQQSLEDAEIRTDLIVVPAGENTKSAAQIGQLWEQLRELGADRKSVVIAVGGGVVGDLAGFLAASYARGIRFYQVPTTILAQVDSSVGGKVGINLPGAKNMVGAFWQPAGVVIDTSVLDTLPEREYRAGLGEVVKYGVILDADFFTYLEEHVEQIKQRDHAVLTQVVARCCQLKADVVENDEREETGLRAVLNYGHTFCHAFETVTGYGTLLHGEAVSIGMLCASRLAVNMGRITSDITDRQYELLAQLGLPVDVPNADMNDLLAAMQRDKKVEHGQLRFVLPTRMGHVELVAGVSPADARRAME